MAVKLDQKDRQLLFELNLNSRQSLPQLARKLRLSKQVVDYRVKRLTQNKMVDYFYTIISFTNLGYTQYKVYLKFQNLTPKKEEEYLDFLSRQKNIAWIAQSRDKYDLALTILAKSTQEFGNIFQFITKDYALYILEKNILLVLYSPIYTKNYLIDSKEKKEIFYAKSANQIEIDEKDQRILKTISINARMPIVNLMEKTGLTRDILNYHLKKLQKENIMLQYSTRLNYQNMGLKLYKIMLHLKNFTLEQENKLLTFCKIEPNCVQFLKLIGDYDAELEFEVFDEEEIYQILGKIRKEFSEIIRDYNLLQINQQHKLDFYPF